MSTNREFINAVAGDRTPVHVGTFEPGVMYTTAKEAAAKFGGSVPSWTRWIAAGLCGTVIAHRARNYVKLDAAATLAVTKNLSK